MSQWKKTFTLFLIALLVMPLLLPTLTLADNLTSASGGITPTQCPPGQQFNVTSNACAAISIPTSTIGTATDGPCKGLSGTALTQCQNTQASKSTLQQFNPNANISSGNTYGGMSISGVGGAIASCANVGSFLVSSVSSLLASTGLTKTIKSAFSSSGSGSDAVSTSDEKAQKQLKTINNTSQCLDGIAYAVAKNVLAQITNKTLNWVNTGLNGNPLYVQNTNSYLGSIATQQIGNALTNIQSGDPVFGNALQSAIRFQTTGRSDGQLNVSLNTPQSKEYNSFMNNFTSGGWNALLNPANNPIGAFFNATDKLNNQVISSQQSALNEIQRNNGFLDMKRCVKYSNSGQSTCVQWVTDTPGSVIANTVNYITSSPTRQLEYANKINEVLGNFFDSFVNNLLSKGLRGSGSRSKINFGFSAPGDNSLAAINVSGGLNATDGSTGQLGYQSSTSSNSISTDFDISHPQQLFAILQTQRNFLNRTLDAQISLQRVIPAIGALDYCVPGPNPDWQNGLDSNWQAFLGSTQQADPRDVSTVEKIVYALPGVGTILGTLVSLFTGSGTSPALWTSNGILADKITTSNVQIARTFYAPSGHSDGIQTPSLEAGLNDAYQAVVNQYNFFLTKRNTYVGSPIGDAFEQAAAGDADPFYVDGFLQDAYTETASLANYNHAASTIDQQYDQNISDTQNAIKQLELIRKQVNGIVTVAKARYIADRAAAGNPVDMQCINQAYQIDNSPITGVPRLESSDQQDPMVQHARDSATYFYNNLVK